MRGGCGGEGGGLDASSVLQRPTSRALAECCRHFRWTGKEGLPHHHTGSHPRWDPPECTMRHSFPPPGMGCQGMGLGQVGCHHALPPGLLSHLPWARLTRAVAWKGRLSGQDREAPGTSLPRAWCHGMHGAEQALGRLGMPPMGPGHPLACPASGRCMGPCCVVG